MEIIYFIIVASAAILISHVVSNFSKRIPEPLIQIFVGSLISLCLMFFIENSAVTHIVLGKDFIIEPELFITIFIAPLLFRETEETDIIGLISLRKEVITISFILVFITTIVIGYFVNMFDASINLPAAFALGAVLGPIDAVAIFVLLKNMNIKKETLGIIKGEGLINDASGLIAFQYAVMALNSNNFSLLTAGLDLVVITIGGIVIGVLIGVVKKFVIDLMKVLNVKNTSVYILIELMLPILTCFIANQLKMSGIIAVVSCGAINVFRLPKFNVLSAEIKREKKSLWSMFSYILNSLIFIILGLELPLIVKEVLKTTSFDFVVFLIPLVITLILLITRLVFVFIFTVKIKNNFRLRLRESLVVTLSGPKGAFSLAMAFSLPIVLDDGHLFSHRALIILFTAEIIIFTLILSSVLLPVLMKPDKKKDDEKTKQTILVLKDVIAELKKRKEKEQVISSLIYYMGRLEDFEKKVKRSTLKKEYKEFRSDFFYYLIIELKSLYLKKKINRNLYLNLARILAIEEEYAIHPALVRIRGIRYKQKLNFEGALLKEEEINKLEKDEAVELYWSLIEKVFHDIIKENKVHSNTLILVLNNVVNLSSQAIDVFFGKNYKGKIYHDFVVQNLIGFDIERQVILKRELENKLDKNLADKMRILINNIESHTLNEKYNDNLSRLISANIRHFKKTHSKKYLMKEELVMEQLRKKIVKLH